MEIMAQWTILVYARKEKGNAMNSETFLLEIKSCTPVYHSCEESGKLECNSEV